MAERDIFANSCQRAWGVSQTCLEWPIKRGALSGTRHTWKCSPQCSSSTKSGGILSSSWPSSSFGVVVNKVLCRSCEYIPHEGRNGQWCTNRNTAQIPGLTQRLGIPNNTHSGQDRPQFYCSKCCGNNSEVLCIERAAAGICTCCPVRAK